MKIREAVVVRLECLCEQRGVNANKLAYDSGVHPSTLKSIINGNSKNPGVGTITKLCDGLDISVQEFFGVSIFDDLEQEID